MGCKGMFLKCVFLQQTCYKDITYSKHGPTPYADKHGPTPYAGDQEVRCRRAEEGGSEIHPEKDWANKGCNAASYFEPEKGGGQ